MASEAESQSEIVDVVEDGEMEDSDLDTIDMLLRRVGDLTEVEQCKMEIRRLRDTSYDGHNIWRFDLQGAATVKFTVNLTGQGSKLSYSPLYIKKYTENLP